MTDSPSSQSDKLSPEAYTMYKSTSAPGWMGQRTAERQAAFFLPYLRAGMDLLDCGCGPGSITVGLARIVSPGQAVGIDVDATQVGIAQKHADEQGVSSVRFEAASIYQLPFPDASFDAVFSNAVLGHLNNPADALREIYRVLKVGGVAGVRTTAMEGILFTPAPPLLVRHWELVAEVIAQKGASFTLGKEQRSLMRQAGFVNVEASASYENYGSLEATRQWAGIWSSLLGEENFIQQLVNAGAERGEVASIRQAWQEWAEYPDAFFADAYGEAVGWKM